MKNHFQEFNFNSFLNLKFLSFFCVFAVLFLSGCKEKDFDYEDSVSLKGGVKAYFPLDFDWEDPNLNWMPYPTNTINPPWVGLGSLYSNVDPDVLTDIKKSDGWVLVYNTFNTESAVPNPYFILYNKYRGIMRVFLYLNNVDNITASSYLQDGIFSYNYRFLNFGGSAVVDADNISYRVDKIESKPRDGSMPFTPNRWYMLQYEMAYDPFLIPSTSPNPPQFSFYVNAININSVKLDGGQEGTLRGTIGSSSSSNIFSTIANNLAKPLGSGVLAAVGSNFFENHYDPTYGLGMTGVNNNLGLANDTFEKLQEGVNNALTKSASSLPGGVINILSAIIGGNNNNQQTISLKLSTKISLAGTISSNSTFIAPTSFYIPGSIKPNANGGYNAQHYIPLYNKPLGVFNISNVPIVIVELTDHSHSNPDGSFIQSFAGVYTLDMNSFQVFWNPEIINNATISNVNYEILVPVELASNTNTSMKISNPEGRIESPAGAFHDKYIASLSPLSITNQNCYREYGILLRISFNVNPHDGSPTSTIVKTFKTNTIVSYNNF